jgi:dihydroorotate dehydrogenase (NAD+) catalytic subunit
MVKTAVKLGPLNLQNPIITASGTFGYGIEFAEYFDINKLGAITLKSVTVAPRAGNAPPRIAESPSGMMNSIGLANHGIDVLINTILPKLEAYDKVKIIANIAGHTLDENVELAKQLDQVNRVDAIELNISCPNVDAGGLAFCQDLPMVKHLTVAVRNVTLKPLIVKLSASVPDIVALANTAVQGGADILSLINTIPGMDVDIARKALFFKRGSAGLSGPAIRPIALKAVYDVAQAVDIPIIGMGGVASVDDVLKFLLVGADAVSVGMMNFVRPTLSAELVDQLSDYLVASGESLATLKLNK